MKRRLYRRLQPAVGVLLLVLALPPLLGMPVTGAWIAVPAAVYIALLYWFPALWLLVLPLATVTLDLTTWTGRFLYNEFDLLFLATIASGLLYSRYRVSRVSRGPGRWLLLAWLALLLLGLDSWRVFLDPPAQAWSNPYYDADYGYKLIRAALWAALLAPLWLSLYRDNAQRAVNSLVAGFCIAALALGGIILWERGTLGVLLAGSAWYHVVNSLLDLSSSYRVTGIFSDMHTGGEVLDGVIVLLLPGPLYGLFHWRRPLARLGAAAALLSLAYCTLVGFTRTTYVAVGLGVALYLGWQVWRYWHRTPVPPRDLLRAVSALVAALAAAWAAFAFAGSYGLLGFAALQLLGFLAWWGARAGRRYFMLSVVLLLAVLLGLVVISHLNSRWVESSSTDVILLVSLFLVSFLLTWRGSRALGPMAPFSRLCALGALVVMPAVVAFALGGSQINSRMEAVSSDMQTRLDHWQRVVQSRESGLVAQIAGTGAGSFPAAYLATFPETVGDVGSFSIVREQETYLRLGAGSDLAFGQRVAVKPDTLYAVQLEARASRPVRLAVFLCERNVIFASNFMATCSSRSVRLQASGEVFQPQRIALASKRVGEGPLWRRWPTVMYLKNFTAGTTVDIRFIDLLGGDSAGLHNTDFSRGMDHWFFYNDFSHLPWHIKNTPLQFWYDHGWLGVVLMLFMLLLALKRALNARTTEEILPALMSGVLVLLLLGLFGTPLDSARAAWLFYFSLFVLLLIPRGQHVRS